MKKYKKCANIILGTSIIAIVLNLFFVNTELFPAGIYGLVTLYHAKVGMELYLTVLLANIFFILLGYLVFPREKMKKAYLTFMLIPLFVFLTKDIVAFINLDGVDKLLLAMYGGVLMGVGTRFIYKEGLYISGSDIIAEIEKAFPSWHHSIAVYVVDFIVVLIASAMYGIEASLYSLLSITIIEYLSKRASLGVSDSKVFYIITKKDSEVRKFILEDMHYELTVFDVKGGFLKTKNKVLMSVIPTKDYYKLKEGVKSIDPEAFISITDSYEAINQNGHLKKKKKESI